MYTKKINGRQLCFLFKTRNPRNMWDIKMSREIVVGPADKIYSVLQKVGWD